MRIIASFEISDEDRLYPNGDMVIARQVQRAKLMLAQKLLEDIDRMNLIQMESQRDPSRRMDLVTLSVNINPYITPDGVNFVYTQENINQGTSEIYEVKRDEKSVAFDIANYLDGGNKKFVSF